MHDPIPALKTYRITSFNGCILEAEGTLEARSEGGFHLLLEDGSPWLLICEEDKVEEIIPQPSESGNA